MTNYQNQSETKEDRESITSESPAYKGGYFARNQQSENIYTEHGDSPTPNSKRLDRKGFNYSQGKENQSQVESARARYGYPYNLEEDRFSNQNSRFHQIEDYPQGKSTLGNAPEQGFTKKKQSFASGSEKLFYKIEGDTAYASGKSRLMVPSLKYFESQRRQSEHELNAESNKNIWSASSFRNSPKFSSHSKSERPMQKMGAERNVIPFKQKANNAGPQTDGLRRSKEKDRISRDGRSPTLKRVKSQESRKDTQKKSSNAVPRAGKPKRGLRRARSLESSVGAQKRHPSIQNKKRPIGITSKARNLENRSENIFSEQKTLEYLSK